MSASSNGSAGGPLNQMTSPQNLSVSPPITMRVALPSSPNSLDPESPNDKNCPADLDVVEVGDPASPQSAAKEGALNMSVVGTVGVGGDMRSNSIATLRIKAKEHLESLNKGLAMV